METAAKSKTEDAKHKTVYINRTFNLPLGTVWKAWTEPESFKKWWGPKNYTCPDCFIDLKVGGSCLASMQDIKTGQKIWSLDTYKEIVPNKKLVCTDNFSDSKGNIIAPPQEMTGDWSKQMLITLELEEKNGKTNLSLKHEGLPVEQYQDCITGWNESLDKLENNLKQ